MRVGHYSPQGPAQLLDPTNFVFSSNRELYPRRGKVVGLDSRSRSYFTTDSIEHPCGTCDQILFPVGMLLSEICGLVSIGCPLWREDGSAICSAGLFCCKIAILVSHITTDGQSVVMSRYRAHSGTCDQILLSVRRLLSEICCLVFLGRPLWREDGSVICLSLSSNLPLFTSIIYVTCVSQFNNLYTINIKLHSVPSEYSRLCCVSYFYHSTETIIVVLLLYKSVSRRHLLNTPTWLEQFIARQCLLMWLRAWPLLGYNWVKSVSMRFARELYTEVI
jgi:hypothetical protein